MPAFGITLPRKVRFTAGRFFQRYVGIPVILPGSCRTRDDLSDRLTRCNQRPTSRRWLEPDYAFIVGFNTGRVAGLEIARIEEESKSVDHIVSTYDCLNVTNEVGDVNGPCGRMTNSGQQLCLRDELCLPQYLFRLLQSGPSLVHGFRKDFFDTARFEKGNQLFDLFWCITDLGVAAAGSSPSVPFRPSG
jgi:hypothetical protein